MQKFFIVANWKQNPKSLKEANLLASFIDKEVQKNNKIEVVVCPPSIYISELLKRKGIKKFTLGAQDSSFTKEGPHTGEIPIKALSSFGVKYSIVGHSDRRRMGDTNEIVSEKVSNILSERIIPILCVGEKERNDDFSYFSFVREQIEVVFKNNPTFWKNGIIVYEPVWAISSNSGRVATPHEFEEMIIFIQKVVSDLTKGKGKVKILYGGSVDDKDAEGFLSVRGGDGVLIGRASLNAKQFTKICQIAKEISTKKV